MGTGKKGRQSFTLPSCMVDNTHRATDMEREEQWTLVLTAFDFTLAGCASIHLDCVTMCNLSPYISLM